MARIAEWSRISLPALLLVAAAGSCLTLSGAQAQKADTAVHLHLSRR